MHKIKYVLVVLLIVSFLTSSLSPAPIARAQASNDDILHVELSEPSTIDPAQFSYVNEGQVIQEVFAGLVKINPTTGLAEPDLAESWTWDATNSEYTFTLRPNLKWSDGVPLTAADVRYGILRTLRMNTGLASLLDPIQNAASYRNGAITGDQVGVFADTNTQLRIRLSQTVSFFDKILAGPEAYPVPQHVVEAHPDDWTAPQYIVASGPYRLASWQPGASMRLVANANYYGAAPLIPEIDIQLNLSDDAQWNAYLSGSLDTIDIPLSKKGVAASDPIIKAGVISVQDYCTYSLKFNTSAAPFGDLNVRKAFTAAIDRQGIVDNVLSGAGLVTQTLTPPGVYGATTGVGIPFDANQAQQYLSAAGYPGGSGFPAVTVQVLDIPSLHVIWGAMQAQWKTTLNVDVTIHYVSAPQGIQPLRWNGWCADYNDGYNFLYDDVIGLEQHYGYLGTWNNASYNGLMQQIAGTTDPASRLPLYQQAEQILTETDTVVAPVYVNITRNLTHDYLKRDFAGFSSEPWHLWSIVRADSSTYTPGSPQTYVPAVGHTAYTLPDNLFDQATTLTQTVLRQEDALAGAPSGLAGIGEVFSIEAAPTPPTGPRAMAVTPQTQTSTPYTITVKYSPEQLTSAHIGDEATLALYALVNGAWVRQTSAVDTQNHRVTAPTQEMNTTFAVLGEPQYFIYLPTTIR